MADVTIYTTPTCGFCRMAEEYFNKSGVAYKKVDLNSDPEAVKWVKDNTGQLGVPVIKIDDKIIIGFDKPTIEQVLHPR